MPSPFSSQPYRRGKRRKPSLGLTRTGLLLVLAGLLILAIAFFGPAAVRSNTAAVATATPAALLAQASPTAARAASNATVAPAVATLVAVAASPTADPQKPLAGRRIAIDPGHGPRGDVGAVLTDPNTGKLILSEAEFNLDVAMRCRDLLTARGADVMLTRETADTFTAPWPVDANGDGIVGASGDDLQERIDIFNNFHAEVFLSIHANSLAEGGTGDDLQVIYCGGSDCGFPTQSKQLAQTVLAHLKAGLADAGYDVQGAEAADDLAVDSSNPPLHMFLLGPPSPPRHVRAPQMPGVLGETLYVTNPTEAPILKRDDVRQAIAQGYADGLQAYLTEGR